MRRGGQPFGRVRVAAARRAQRAQRAGGDCRRRVVRARRRRRSPTGCGRSRASSGGSKRSASRAASRCSTTSRTIRPRCTRRCRRCGPAIRTGGSGRCSSRARPRRAAGCFRTTSRARSAPPTKWSSRRCSARRCPRRSGSSAEQLVDDLRAQRAARAPHPRVDEIIAHDRRASTATGRRRADVQRRLRRHPPQAAAGARPRDHAVRHSGSRRLGAAAGARSRSIDAAGQRARHRHRRGRARRRRSPGVRDVVSTYPLGRGVSSIRSSTDVARACERRCERACAAAGARARRAARSRSRSRTAGEWRPGPRRGRGVCRDCRRRGRRAARRRRLSRVHARVPAGLCLHGARRSDASRRRGGDAASAVPAGSVGIAGRADRRLSVGLPGGWQIIGRTPLRSSTPTGRRRRCLRLAIGCGSCRRTCRRRRQAARACVRRHAVTRTASAQVVITVFAPACSRPSRTRPLGPSGESACRCAARWICDAHRLANALVGNDADAATLEATLARSGAALEHDATFAIAGADLGATHRRCGVPLTRRRAVSRPAACCASASAGPGRGRTSRSTAGSPFRGARQPRHARREPDGRHRRTRAAGGRSPARLATPRPTPRWTRGASDVAGTASTAAPGCGCCRAAGRLLHRPTRSKRCSARDSPSRRSPIGWVTGSRAGRIPRARRSRDDFGRDVHRRASRCRRPASRSC